MRGMYALVIATGMIACAPAQEQQDPLAAQRRTEDRMLREFQAGLKHVRGEQQLPPEPEPSSIPEKIRMAFWDGTMLIDVNSDGLQVLALFTTDIGTRNAKGMVLPRTRTSDGWLFEVPGSFTYRAVRIRNNDTVIGEIWVGDPPNRTVVTVQGFKTTAAGLAPCIQRFCDDIFKLDGNTIVDCEGSRCADLLSPKPPKPPAQQL